MMNEEQLVYTLYPLVRLVKTKRFRKIWNAVNVCWGCESDDYDTKYWRYEQIYYGVPLDVEIKGRIKLQAYWEREKMDEFREMYNEHTDGLATEENCMDAAASYLILRTVTDAARRAGLIDAETLVDFLRNRIKADELVPKRFELIPEPILVFTGTKISFTNRDIWQPVVAFAEEHERQLKLDRLRGGD